MSQLKSRTSGLGRVVELRSLAWFTCLFVLTVCAMYGPLLATGKTLIRVIDGLDQHYPFFLYIGRWMRAAVRGLLGGSAPGVWDMNMGYGADMRTTLSAYVTDPFNWLSVFVPTSLAESGFVATVVLRLWFAGVSFLSLARYREWSCGGSVIAALMYCTCAVTLNAPIESFFVNPMITFPLVVRGMLHVMDGRTPTLYVCSLAATFCFYFYFGYMTCILIVPAWLGETVSRRTDWRSALRQLGSFVAYSLLGIALSAIVILPVLKVVLQTGRLSIERPQDLLYGVGYYRNVLAGIAGWANVGPDSFIGFGAVGLVSLLLLLTQSGHAFEKVTIGAYTVILLVPFLGRALNGFAYVTNRWTWAYALAFASAVATCLPQAPERGRDKRLVMAMGAAYATWLIWLGFGEKVPDVTRWQYVISAVAVMSLLVVLLLHSGADAGSSSQWFGICVAAIVICSGAAATFTLQNAGRVFEQLDSGTGLDRLTEKSPYRALLDVAPVDEGSCDWRADRLVSYSRNTALINGVRSYDYYISVYNEKVDRLHSLLGLVGTCKNVEYTNLDSRPGLELAFGSRFVITDNEGVSRMPYGFSGAVESRGYEVSESTAYWPIASLRQKTVSEVEFLDASMAEREAMLRDAVVVDGEPKKNSNRSWFPPVEVSASAQPIEECELGDHFVDVASSGGTANLTFNANDGATYYLELVGCSFEPMSDTTSRTVEFRAADGHRITALTLMSLRHHMSGGKRDWVVNLGSFASGEQVVTVKFSHAGTYRYTSARLVEVSAQDLDHARAEAASHMGDVSTRFGADRIECSVTASQPSTLLITTPWSEGWSATVDGEPAEVGVADVAFMKVDVLAGNHEVVLRYTTPGLLAGAIISGLAAGVTLYLARRTRDGEVER